jgi:hypothetical protein
MRRRSLLLASLVAVVLLAGCAGLAGEADTATPGSDGDSESRFSNVTAGVDVDAGPAIVFNYSLNDYATVLLENPNSQVVDEQRLEPDLEWGGVLMADPQPGTYELVLRRGGETIETRNVTFNGSERVIRNVNATWDGNSLQQLNVTLGNTGDLPYEVRNASYAARGKSVGKDYIYKWVPTGVNRTVSLTPSYDGEITMSEGGTFRANITLNTTHGQLHDELQREFEGPNLSIVETTPYWNGTYLNAITVAVNNSGDMATEVEGGLKQDFGYSSEKTVEPNETVLLNISDLGYVYRASSPGDHSLTVLVKSPHGNLSTNITKSVQGSTLSIVETSPTWRDGVLTDYEYTIRNSGELEGYFESRLFINGERIASGYDYPAANTTKQYQFKDDLLEPILRDGLYAPTAGGNYDIRLEVTTDERTLSKTSTKSFDGPEIEVNDVSPTFYKNYGEDTYRLSSIDYIVSNTGDTAVEYDTVEYSIAGSSETTGYNPEGIGAKGRENELVSLTELSVSSGEHQLTISFYEDSEKVGSDTVIVSAN